MTLPQLPVSDILPELADTLCNHDRVILEAPTGTGKTTLVPLDLLQSHQYQGKILVLEPRRLAASAAANRMASLIGEATGETVGYRMQLENRTSDKTRIEVITEGILTRMLQTDPELHGVDMVIFDEFHERSLQADLGLALCLQSQEVFREQPLKILIMSATLETGKLARQLSAPVVTSKGFLFPVVVQHLQKPWPDRHFFTVCEQTSRQVLQVLSEESGSVLVFLPGSGEIRQTHKILESSQLPDDVEIHPLFGDLSLALQRKAIEPAGKGLRKVVLATNIAETSLTIEGIRIVIDSGLTRRAVYDPGTGMTRLITRRISRSSADQRKGRAGRLEPGICYRLWTASEEAAMEATTPAEITEADLSPLALELSCWGAEAPDELFWLDPPVESRYQNALQLLQQLQAVDSRNRITPHGGAMASLGAHPRIGHLLLLAAKKKQSATGCCLAAILSERDLLKRKGLKEPGRSADLTQRLSLFDPQAPVSKQAHPSLGRVKHKMRQWQQRLKSSTKEPVKPELAPSLLIAAWPDRIAQRRGNTHHYLLASGQGVELHREDHLGTSEYLVAPHIGGQQSRSNAQVFLACPVSKADIYEELAELIEEDEVIAWNPQKQRVTATRQDRLGALVLEQQNLEKPSKASVAKALMEGIRQSNLQLLPWDKAATRLKQRLVFLSQYNPHLDTPFPDCSNAALMDSLEQWLGPYLVGITRAEQLKKLKLADLLLNQLTWDQQQTLDEQAPDHWQAPSGSRIRINYDHPEEPVISARLQELFGLQETPMIAFHHQPLTIELLSPAHRPVQITRDLGSFWKNTYHEVKKDLKGRYPKHYWPDDPHTAEPTHRVRPGKSGK